MTNNKTPLQEALDKLDEYAIENPISDDGMLRLIQKAAQAYADLPDMIKAIKVDTNYSATFKGEYNYAYNRAIDDILNLLKEIK